MQKKEEKKKKERKIACQHVITMNHRGVATKQVPRCRVIKGNTLTPCCYKTWQYWNQKTCWFLRQALHYNSLKTIHLITTKFNCPSGGLTSYDSDSDDGSGTEEEDNDKENDSDDDLRVSIREKHRAWATRKREGNDQTQFLYSALSHLRASQKCSQFFLKGVRCYIWNKTQSTMQWLTRCWALYHRKTTALRPIRRMKQLGMIWVDFSLLLFVLIWLTLEIVAARVCPLKRSFVFTGQLNLLKCTQACINCHWCIMFYMSPLV